MHPRGGKLGFVTVSLENGQGKKYFIPATETVTNSCGSWGVPPRARRPSFFLGGRFPIFFAFSGSSPFSQNRGENRFERDAPAFSRGRLTCGGLHFFFFFRHFMCTLPSKFILHIWRISRWLKGIYQPYINHITHILLHTTIMYRYEFQVLIASYAVVQLPPSTYI